MRFYVLSSFHLGFNRHCHYYVQYRLLRAGLVFSSGILVDRRLCCLLVNILTSSSNPSSMSGRPLRCHGQLEILGYV